MVETYEVAPEDQIAGDLGDKLKQVTSGCKLEINSLSCGRKMTESQKLRMAETFSADTKSVSGSREIINRKMKVVQPLFQAIRTARNVWKAHSVKYEDGVRLIRTDRIAWMNAQIGKYQSQAIEAAQAVHDAWDSVREDAKARLNELYIPSDYDFDIRDVIGMTISYPAIEPDSRLKEIAPELYKAEHQRIRAQFKEAALVAEEALLSEFRKLLGDLTEKLTGQSEETGKKKVVQQRGIDALVSFAERFSSMAIGSNVELDALVEKAKALAGETTIADLKDAGKKASFSEALADVTTALETCIANAPIRNFEL